MKRKIAHLTKMIKHYTQALDHATTPAEIGMALKMKTLYENALIALEEQE